MQFPIPCEALMCVPLSPTCPLLNGRADFPTEEDIDMIEDELDHHRLNPHFHESCGAAEAGRLDLL